MNGDLDRNYAAEDDGADEDMMFEFEQEHEGNTTKFTSLAALESNTNGTGIAFGATLAELRPPNPVAALLQSRDLGEDSDDDDDSADDELQEFCSSPFRGSSERSSLASLGGTPPTSQGLFFSCERPQPFDYNDRRKRKCMDDGVVGACRVRPLAKRAKSFSFGRDSAALQTDYPIMFGSPALDSAIRSESISIPKPTSVRSAARSRSHSGSAAAGDSASSHSHSSSSPSWNATTSSSPSWNATTSSLEYFCRRSLDVSSPLRLRFRDLMVGSVGRATSYNGP